MTLSVQRREHRQRQGKLGLHGRRSRDPLHRIRDSRKPPPYSLRSFRSHAPQALQSFYLPPVSIIRHGILAVI